MNEAFIEHYQSAKMVLHSQGKALWSALIDCTHMVPLKRELHQDDGNIDL